MIVGREVETTVASTAEMMVQKRKPRSVGSAEIVSAGLSLDSGVVLIVNLTAFPSLGVLAWHYFPLLLKSPSLTASICIIHVTAAIAA